MVETATAPIAWVAEGAAEMTGIASCARKIASARERRRDAEFRERIAHLPAEQQAALIALWDSL